MTLNARNVKGTGNGSKIPLMEPGTYPARLSQVVDMGVQKQREYKGEAKEDRHEINLTYEFVEEFIPDDDGNEQKDKPYWLSERMPFYSLEAERAKSTARYYALDPKEEVDGDFTKLVGFPCMVTVVESKPNKDGRTFNNITGVSPMVAKMASKLPDLVHPPKVFTLDDPDIEVFQSLPKWLQERVKENVDYEGSALEKALQQAPKASTDAPEEEESDEGGEEEKTATNNEAEGDW